MTWAYTPVFARHLQPGDYCSRDWDGRDPYTVLRRQEEAEDLFGRKMIRYWCRALEDEREGWMTFGPNGIAYRKTAEVST